MHPYKFSCPWFSTHLSRICHTVSRLFYGINHLFGKISLIVLFYYPEQTVPYNFAVLGEVPKADVGESESSERWDHHCGGWTPWQYGALCQVWCLHHILLHHSNDSALFTYPGMRFKFVWFDIRLPWTFWILTEVSNVIEMTCKKGLCFQSFQQKGK